MLAIVANASRRAASRIEEPTLPMRDRRQIQPCETPHTDAPTTFWARYREITCAVKRGFIAEWTVTIVLLLFATTSLAQAFVIPSGSMEDSLLTGDHVLVDKLVYSPPG